MYFFTIWLLTIPDWPLTIDGQIRDLYTVLLMSKWWQENLRFFDFLMFQINMYLCSSLNVTFFVPTTSSQMAEKSSDIWALNNP